jgi:phosphohistidine phosphatase
MTPQGLANDARPGWPMTAGGPVERRLVLLRHAKAVQTDWGSDRSRSLSERGQAQAKAVGLAFKELGFTPDVALVSSATRTLQTYQLVAANAGWDLEPDVSYELYRAYIAELIDLLNELAPAAVNVLVVGHQPTMSATAAALAGPDSRPEALTQVRQGLPTGGLAELAFAGPWADLRPGTATLVRVARP